MKSRRAGPPDRGYSWVVLMSAFVVMGLSTAILTNFGIFFLVIQNHFGVPISTTSMVSSTKIAMYFLGAPVASVLTVQFSQRVVIIVGGLLASSGLCLASLDLSLPWLYLSVGFLQGLGISFAWVAANSMVSHYFVRWRPIALAIAISGECVFTVMFSPFFQWLIEMYSWQGSLLIIGGLQLNLCVCGALMRPLETVPLQETKHGQQGEGVVHTPKKKVIFQCSLMRKPEFILYLLFGIISAAGIYIPRVFLVPFASSLGMDKYWSALLLSVLSGADLVGRLLCGLIANMRLLRNLQLLTIVVALLGVGLLLLPISHNCWTILVFASLYGFLFGCVVAVHITAIVDIVTLEGFDTGLGLFMLSRSIGGFSGPPAGGWLVDNTNTYSAAFYLSGLCLISSALFVVLVDRLVQRRKIVKGDGHQVINQEGREVKQVK